MNNKSKAVSIILYLIWPFSGLLIGVKNFDSVFGRKLLIAALVFLGFTAIEFGDLEAYALNYYKVSDNKLVYLIDLFVDLQVGKFFNDFTAVLFSVFENHHIYFAFLFGFYGYFLINSVNLLRLTILKKSNLTTSIGFITFASFYSILTIFNYAFYTGAIFFLYYLLKLIFNKNSKKYYFLIFLTPLFHIGLTPLLLIPIVYLVFAKRTILYIILLIFFSTISHSFIINTIGARLTETDTVFENRYNTYASEEGKERMDNRYSEGYQSGNLNYKISRDGRDAANKIALPLLLLILLINKEKFNQDRVLLDLFHLSIAGMAVTNLMLNISQGERFYLISGFLILGTYVYYIQTYNYQTLKYRYLLFLIIPCILFSNLISLIMAKELVSSEFLFSNFPYMLFKLI